MLVRQRSKHLDLLDDRWLARGMKVYIYITRKQVPVRN